MVGHTGSDLSEGVAAVTWDVGLRVYAENLELVRHNELVRLIETVSGE